MSSDPLPLLSESSCGTGPGSVPVFNCIVILTPLENGRLRGRVANLPGVAAEGNNERELLMLLTKQFKSIVKEALSSGTGLQWTEPPETPVKGESQRFIPVHL